MTKKKAMLAMLCLAMSAVVAFAQGNATISGQVTDEKGQPVHGVAMSAKQGRKSVTVVTKFDGRYTIGDLTPGMCEVRAVREGRSEERRVGKECRL